MPGSAACGVLKDAKIISRHSTLALLSFQVFINLSKLVTSWWPWPREAYPVGRPRGTHADPITVSLIHDETPLWPTVNTTGNRKTLRWERDARLIKERFSACAEVLKWAAKHTHTKKERNKAVWNCRQSCRPGAKSGRGTDNETDTAVWRQKCLWRCLVWIYFLPQSWCKRRWNAPKLEQAVSEGTRKNYSEDNSIPLLKVPGTASTAAGM